MKARQTNKSQSPLPKSTHQVSPVPRTMNNKNLTVIILILVLYCSHATCTETPKEAANWITGEEAIDTPTSEIFSYSYTPDPNLDLWGLLELKLYIPGSLERIRGIYCYVPGWQGSSMIMITNKSLRTYVKNKGFALMTFTTEGEYTSKEEGITRWSEKAFLEGLKKLAVKSGHPEIEHAPLLFNGHSAGGQFAYHFTLLHPQRVIAFTTIKGGLHSLAPAGEATKVPAFLVIGEKDKKYRKTNLTTIFNTYRPQKALWSLAMQPNSRHHHVDDAIKHAFFDSVIPLRLPERSATKGPIILKTIDESSAWLGNTETLSIDPYDEFSGDRKKAAWLPDEGFAKVWLNFTRK